ncbi:MAG: GTPase ObgE [Eubacterium sp.]|nr:GTPase ObgE [Eubacterium sp.]
MAFSDKVTIRIRSGDGGDGHVSFRREKYVANGGPDGGDGGRGGDLIFEVDPGLNTLSDFRYQQKFFAKNGEPGGKRRCHGADGDDLVVKVPPGTIVREATTGQVITDMSYENTREVILKGGRGGKGNMNYATPTMQAPKYAQPGKPGIELTVILELKVIADVGLVGFPNVGKSTLLSRVSAAKPKIADYHFTTLNPNLGVVDIEGANGFVMADIPGLIEGAADGVGLGHDFLRHIERTRVIVHVVDAASVEGRDPIVDINTINRELSDYDEELAKRPQIIAANKLDCVSPEERDDIITLLRAEFDSKGVEVCPISAATGEGVRELLYKIRKLLDETPIEPVTFEREYEIDLPDFSDEPYTVSVSDEEENTYLVEGPRIERMLGYTNLDSEKGFVFFQKFMKENGIIDELISLGIEEGDTVKIYGWQFEYYK